MLKLRTHSLYQVLLRFTFSTSTLNFEKKLYRCRNLSLTRYQGGSVVENFTQLWNLFIKYNEYLSILKSFRFSLVLLYKYAQNCANLCFFLFDEWLNRLC